MRDAFVKALEKQARRKPEIYLLVADLGFLLFDDFKKAFRKRFINVGVAEANMVGIASGLALCGKIPFLYSIVPFLTSRAFEQIKVDICYQNLNVKVVGVGAGFAYGPLGPTHHAIEDIALMRVLPNMTILSPADALETEKCIKAAVMLKGPVYLRLVKSGEPRVYKNDYKFKIGDAMTLRDGKDVTIITTGGLVHNCLLAADLLSKEDISVAILNFHTIKPIDKQAILTAASRTKAIISVEEHSIVGGLGSAVAEVLAENYIDFTRFKRVGINDTFCEKVGSHSYLQQAYGLSSQCIAERAKEFLTLIDRKGKI